MRAIHLTIPFNAGLQINYFCSLNLAMKKVIFSLLSLLALGTVPEAQQGLPAVDRSPLDVSYYPHNYPVLKIQDKVTEPLVARVIYSRPQRAGRPIFGGLVKYGELWRLGANEATEIEFFRNVHIGNKKINKGRYTLYAIVNENNWTIIVNRETDTWGAFKYNAKKDVVRVNVPVSKSPLAIESLAMSFDKTITGCNLLIAWENVMVSVPMKF
jgi:hypothetical protein